MTALLLFVSSLVASAQATIRVEAPNLVAVGEQFSVSFIIEGDRPSDFQWTPSADFQLIWGPTQSTSTSVSIINGKRTRNERSTYSYALMALKTGTFQLPVANATLKGEQLSSQRVSIEVVADSDAAAGSQGSDTQAQGSSGQQSAGSDIDESDLFLRLTLSKTRVVVGEPITATLKLYQRVNISGFEDARFPTFNGFWSQEVQAPTNIEFRRENVGNRIYNAAVLRSYVIIPQQAGDLKIDPAELSCLVNVRVQQSTGNSIFDSFFMDDYRTIRRRVASPALLVHVSPLPAGAPASFGGGVGNFQISASLTRDSLQAHDAASLKVTVTGRGNVALLEAPKVSFPPDFETYDIKTTDNTDRASGRTNGSKTFEYPFIPRSHGEFEIGPVEYSYYDIAAGRYVTLRSEVLPLQVSRGQEAAAQGQGDGRLVAQTNRRDVRDLGSDIRYIVTKAPSFGGSDRFFVGTPLFWGLTALLVLMALAAWFLLRRLQARRADVAQTRGRTATRLAQKRLSQASAYLEKNLYSAFYEELHKALLGFVSDKLTLDAAEMSKENISERLVASGADADSVAEFTALLDACEYARYAPEAAHEEMNTHYETAVRVVSAIDAAMKRKKKSPSGAAVAVLLLALIPGLARAQEAASYPDSLWAAGVEAYQQGSWDQAVQDWSSITALGVQSAVLEYNLGNAYFKAEDYAHAILHYERALKLDPSFADARYNLEFAGQFIQDRIDTVPEFFVKTWIRGLSRSLSAGTWTVLFFVLLCAALALLLLFLLGHAARGRKAGFFGAIVCALLALLCIAMAARQKSEFLDSYEAIVMRAVTTVRSSPGGEGAKDLFVLHEGTKVKIIDEVGEWKNITLSDGRQGWISVRDIEII